MITEMIKMKKFIFTVPRQKSENLYKAVYKSANSKKLENNISARFPLIPVIDSYCEKNDIIEIIALIASEKDNICEAHDICENNLRLFCDDMNEICAPKGIKYTIKKIIVPFNETLETHLATYYNLIKEIEDNDTIFADITYGSKPIPIVEMMALGFCTKNKTNVMVECLCYGEMDHNTNEKSLFDVTSLFYLNEISDMLSKTKISNPEKFIESVIFKEVV